jgi:vacuolar-type H+-ATPase subunit I/STV1
MAPLTRDGGPVDGAAGFRNRRYQHKRAAGRILYHVIEMTDRLNDTIRELADYQAKLDPDRRTMLNRLLQDVQKYQEPAEMIDDEDQALLLSLVVELKRDLEDVRNQLELERARATHGRQLNLAEAI